ncbi:Ubiquitin conjugating enzyme E2-24KD [Spraguea lophii 42_110]|uniref:Ubiquitin-conjugating enzyme E2 H n=1 Tax=Spraguea lophii (strain 42_110) TaxID=1358809 RepID=S7W8F7_SPRLO|nr:Ubiquitin conjugating enzyme E2-24KD [Spraguea lophii 42_110]
MSRIHEEVLKLKKKNIRIDYVGVDKLYLEVFILGPKDTPYHGGLFIINIQIPNDYPFSSPSIGFKTKIYHPNVDEGSGSICLDVLNQVWSPLFDLGNIIEVFIPQLLAYPNPTDPLNADAANLYMKDKVKYEEMVKMYIKKYAVKNLNNKEDFAEVIDSDSVDL